MVLNSKGTPPAWRTAIHAESILERARFFPGLAEAAERYADARAFAEELRRFQLGQIAALNDRDAGYDYALSMLQVEVSDTRVFDRPIRARQWFEATITEQLTLGRPETVSLLFGRPVEPEV